MTAKKTERKRQEEYLALYKLMFRMKEIADNIAKELSKEADMDEKELSLFLRMPCIACNNLSRCIPSSSIVSIFSCRPYNISTVHHLMALRGFTKRIEAALEPYRKSKKKPPIKVTPEGMKEFEKELIMIRLPGRLRIIYNELIYERYGL